MPDLVFLHGWSVTDTETYGGLPTRLASAARAQGLNLPQTHIYLGEYISFHDEVQLADLAKALQAAIEDHQLGKSRPFLCVTHSTGGPVVREWFQRCYANARKTCPMSHLVMLAPPNFGSALAALGKSTVGRLKAFFNGVEPGQGVLDWLELGSAEAFELNRVWIEDGAKQLRKGGLVPFVLTGQTIDRQLYDAVNSYTGELGSDGVVRCAAANLNATYLKLVQTTKTDSDGFGCLRRVVQTPSVPTAFRLVAGKSHSGKDKGIMRSVGARGKAGDGDEGTIDAILQCFSVQNAAGYRELCETFREKTLAVQAAEQVEREDRILRDRTFIHDRCSQVIFRLMDDEGHAVGDFDLVLTAGADSSPNDLPTGFFKDRQQNSRHAGTITYFVNYDVMRGSPAIPDVREALPGAASLGLEVRPRPDEGFVHYQSCRIHASRSILEEIIRPNETTLIDIELRRVVHQNVLKLSKGTRKNNFKKRQPGKETI